MELCGVWNWKTMMTDDEFLNTAFQQQFESAHRDELSRRTAYIYLVIYCRVFVANRSDRGT